MSKIGKKAIALPAGTKVELSGNRLTVTGPKGNLSYTLLDGVTVTSTDQEIVCECADVTKSNLRGLTRTLIANMVEGVSKGYEKKLMVLGVGYTAKLQGNKLVLSLGFSHPVNFDIPTSLKVGVEKDAKGNDIITISGIDKQFLGEYCAKLRALKKPEPYKGKGIRYLDETIKLKAGKTAKK